MSSRKNKSPLALNMDFGEALNRFAKVDPNKLPIKVKSKRSRVKADPIDEDSAIVLSPD